VGSLHISSGSSPMLVIKDAATGNYVIRTMNEEEAGFSYGDLQHAVRFRNSSEAILALLAWARKYGTYSEWALVRVEEVKHPPLKVLEVL
jgi:hypothetical protein